MRKCGPDGADVGDQVDVEGSLKVLEVRRSVHRSRDHHPGVVHENVERAEVPNDLPDDAVHRVLVGDIQRPALRDGPGARDLLDHRVHTFGAQVGDSNLRALVGEQMSRRAAHAACGTGDEHDLARD